jgi:hypothetical protein
MQLGQTFTIEPILTLGGRHHRCLPDGWTLVTRDGSLAAQVPAAGGLASHAGARWGAPGPAALRLGNCSLRGRRLRAHPSHLFRKPSKPSNPSKPSKPSKPKFEHTLIITEDGAEVLTVAPEEEDEGGAAASTGATAAAAAGCAAAGRQAREAAAAAAAG